jgi:hypothetical protein
MVRIYVTFFGTRESSIKDIFTAPRDRICIRVQPNLRVVPTGTRFLRTAVSVFYWGKLYVYFELSTRKGPR